MENFPESAPSQLKQFKEYAISHPQLAQVDMLLMGAIREPAGFAQEEAISEQEGICCGSNGNYAGQPRNDAEFSNFYD